MKFLLPALLLLSLALPAACVEDAAPGTGNRQQEAADPGAAATPTRFVVADGGVQLGTRYDVVIYTSDKARAEDALKSTRKLAVELEARLSEWQPNSEITRLNQLAGKERVPMLPDVAKLLRGGIAVSAATGGAFDMTFKPLDLLWQRAQERGSLPSEQELADALRSVGSDKISISDAGVFFESPEMRIGIGGFGKGWIIDALCDHLKSRGEDHFIVNIGGDLRIAGNDEQGKPHRLAILDPFDTQRKLGHFTPGQMAVATSGLSFRTREIAGQRFGHIIDPRSGKPAVFEGSVTVVTRDAAMADALATALYVMGPDAGMAWAKGREHLWVLYAERDGVRHNLPDFSAVAE